MTYKGLINFAVRTGLISQGRNALVTFSLCGWDGLLENVLEKMKSKEIVYFVQSSNLIF